MTERITLLRLRIAACRDWGAKKDLIWLYMPPDQPAWGYTMPMPLDWWPR